MPQSSDTPTTPIRAALFSWRTGPFLWSVALSVSCYLILVVLHGAGLPARVLNALEPYSQALTVIGSVALAVQVVTMGRYIGLNDEFMRSLVFKRLALAAFATILVATIWSLLADMGWAPAFEPIYLYLLFIGIAAAMLPFINADRP